MAKVNRIDQQNTPPTLGSGTPTPESVQERRDTVSRFRQLPWQTRNIGAPIQTFARNLPVVGKKISDMMTDGDETAIEGYRAENPVASFGARAAGHSIPYLFGGPASVGGRVAFGAGIEGADALSEGEDPLIGAGLGAIGSGIASAPGKAITPRSQAVVARERNDMSANAWGRVNREFSNRGRSSEYRKKLEEWLGERIPGYNAQSIPGHGVPSANTNIPSNFRDAVVRQTRLFDERYRMDRFREIMEEPRQFPRRNIGMEDIPAWMRGFGAGFAGHSMGLDPIMSGAAGIAAGPASRMARNAGERIVNSPTFNRWYGNSVMSPEMQRILHGSIMGTGHAAGGTPGELAPELKPYEAILSQIRGQQ